MALAILVGLVMAVSALGAAVTLPKISGWYAGLAKPWFNPPSWVFGPVWTLLYLAMAYAVWRVWRCPAGSARSSALRWFAGQLALNAVWSPVFFGAEAPLAAFAVILGLLVSLTATLVRFYPVDRQAALILVPYLAWVGFATLLDGAIVLLNR